MLASCRASLALLCGLRLCCVAFAELSCRDQTNTVQDWLFAYKQPNGFAYAYRDANTKGETPLQISPYSLNSSTNFAWATLHPIYTDKPELKLGYAFFNDESPVGPGTSGAHAKGVIATDGETGFWLVHSVPKYPDLRSTNFAWTASDIYGQSFLCLSLNAAEIDVMAKQVLLMQPQVFAHNMPSSLASKFPNLALLAAGKSGGPPGDNSIVDFKTSGGHAFTSFAKNPKWGKDLYADLVQPRLKVNMVVETWRRSPFLDTYCKGKDGRQYDTRNIDSMQFPTNTFKYTQDHSKWGISADKATPVVCVGGINRMQSQRNRGGGTVCSTNAELWNAINAVIHQTDSCTPGPSPGPGPGPAPGPPKPTPPAPKPTPPPGPLEGCDKCVTTEKKVWCNKDSKCHDVGSLANPCTNEQCVSISSRSSCKCKACTDKSCQVAPGPAPGPSPPGPKPTPKPHPAPKPTPKPAPGPSPAGGCCYEAASTCSKGEVCCKSNCKDPATCSYSKSGCDGTYGKKHHCEWEGSKCVVGSGRGGVEAELELA